MTPQCKLTDYVSLPQMETIIAPHVVHDVLTRCDAWEEREKKISMPSMVYLIIALALYPTASTREVWRRLVEGLSEDAISIQDEIPTAGALCQRRQQLGVTPMRMLFDRCARPIAHVSTASAFRYGRRLVAIDGVLEDLPDTDANRTVYPLHCLQEHSRSPFPQLRCLALMECGTHVIFDAELSTVQQGETTSARALLERSLIADMLVLMDAGITCCHLFAQTRRIGAHALGRLNSRDWSKPLELLDDGSYLVAMTCQDSEQGKQEVMARVIEYRLKHPQTGELSPVIRLVTTLLDPELYTREDLIQLYHERWEIELAFDEVQTHLRLSQRTLRSQTPQGVEQEFYGLLLAFFAVRSMMYLAAVQAGWDPDEVSFAHAIHVVQRSQVRFQQANHERLPHLRQALLQELVQERVPKRRLRFHARVLKRTYPRFKHKHYEHLHVPCFKGSFLDLVVLLI
ncbi:transposase [Dictyobacter formicarum]|uniref:Transposase n=2 Tax=Dictyobacter formicarum TaxID=2778368 RepID=A0ABQ3VM67_9CHLR|nr:transposase [Dictyobacter formicarum]